MYFFWVLADTLEIGRMDSPTSNIRWARLSFHQWSKVEKIKKLFLGYCFGVLLFVLLNNHVEISCCYSLSRGFSLGIDLIMNLIHQSIFCKNSFPCDILGKFNNSLTIWQFGTRNYIMFSIKRGLELALPYLGKWYPQILTRINCKMKNKS